MNNQGGWVYLEDGTVVYRASSLGNCVRSLTAARLGETASGPSAGLRAAMEASSELEFECILRAAREMNRPITDQQKTVEIQFMVRDGVVYTGHVSDMKSPSPLVIVRGHLDGIGGDGSVIEVKALGASNWEKWMSGKDTLDSLKKMGTLGYKYQFQGALYGHAEKRSVRYVIGQKVKRDCGGCPPDDISEPCMHCAGTGEVWDIGDLHVADPIRPEDLIPMSEVMDRIALIEDHAARDELPPCTSDCREGDPFSEVHIFASAAPADDELASLIGRYAVIKRQEDELKDEKDAIRERIITEFGVGKYTAGSFTARVEHVKPTQRIDGKRLRKELPDVYEEFTTWGSPTIRLTVTGGKRDDD